MAVPAPRRIAIMGAPGAGKSTLIAELAARGWRTVPEAARTILQQPGGMDLRAGDPLGFAQAMLDAVQQLMNEPLFLDKMLIKFSELCDKYLQQLEHELTIDELILLAHSAKGASAGLGFEQLAEAAKQLELNLKQYSQIKNPELIAQLRASLMQAKSFLEQRKSGC